MPLVVPILRLGMVSLNVYETFKTLKVPPPSSRNGGKPSVRALSQRKRDMKGCLTVWIVWVCFTIYERIVEGIISLFIPFYDEFKSLALIFLILTRARSAEPIFLHVIRPMLKPYTATLDMVLDLACMFGDIIFLLVTYPIRHAKTWWHKSIIFDMELLDSEAETARPDLSTASLNQGRLGPQKSKSHRPHPLSLQSGPDEIIPVANGHQVWHPPASSYVDDTEGGAVPHVEEWRLYPNCPSAYPPTPLFTNSKILASSAPDPTQEIFNPLTLPESPQPDFRSSLPPLREPLRPGFAGSSSDEIHPYSGTQRQDEAMNVDVNEDDNDDDDASDVEVEDDFDITLRSPLMSPRSPTNRRHYRQGTTPRSPRSPSGASSHTQGLSTAYTASSYRTRTSSDATSSSLSSSSPFALGKKRVHPRGGTTRVIRTRVRRVDEVASRKNTTTNMMRSASGTQLPRRKYSPRVRKTAPVGPRSRVAETSDTPDRDPEKTTSEDEPGDDDDDVEEEEHKRTEMKRRKVVVATVASRNAIPLRSATNRGAARPLVAVRVASRTTKSAVDLTRVSSSSTTGSRSPVRN